MIFLAVLLCLILIGIAIIYVSIVSASGTMMETVTESVRDSTKDARLHVIHVETKQDFMHFTQHFFTRAFLKNLVSRIWIALKKGMIFRAILIAICLAVVVLAGIVALFVAIGLLIAYIW